MTVKEAGQSVLALTGVLDVCSCNQSALLEAVLISINRAMQELWMDRSGRFQTLEDETVTFSTGAPVDLPATIQSVVGPLRFAGRATPVPLAGSESAFTRYFQASAPTAAALMWDDLVFASPHDVGGGVPYWGCEFLLPLWDDREILIWFDDAAESHAVDFESGTSLAGFSVSEKTISCRVEIPTVDTPAADIVTLVIRAIKFAAGAFITPLLKPGNKVRVIRRRAGDIEPWQEADTGLSNSVTAGPRTPQVAWAETRKASSGNDNAGIRLHVAPQAAGDAVVSVVKQPPAYTTADLDIETHGTDSTTIALAHEYCASLLLPLAREAFAQDYIAFLTPEAAAGLAAITEGARTARASLRSANPNSEEEVA